VTSANNSGRVYLVGGGPGDPGLITRRAADLIARADVIVYDRLISPELLAGAREDAERIYVGKEPGANSVRQEDINELMVQRARNGLQVVRLKGGDPFVFGRGGEEAEALADAGIGFEVVPGVTAGVAAAAYAGIPVTHRDQSSAVAFVTGHEDPTKDESSIDWQSLAAFKGTLVFYMGVSRLAQIADRLIEHGRSPGEPAAVVERASLPGQRTVTAPLGEIADRASVVGIHPPAVTVVGEVAGLREQLAWFEQVPLHGKTVAVTRARAQASTLAARLSQLGAEVIELPAIRIVPRDSAQIVAAVRALEAGDYDVVCITSPNGAELLADALERRADGVGALAGTTVAAIGPGTEQALAERGIEVDIVPEKSIAESLVEELRRRVDLEDKRVLLGRAADAREVLPESLRAAGAQVDVVALYDTVREEISAPSLALLAHVDYVTFTSSSTVRYFVEALGGTDRFPAHARVVSIGPVTSATARELGLPVHAEAQRHDIDGLVETLVSDSLAAAD
jgi:uroporphyrinogen III methyltransferase / synthase